MHKSPSQIIKDVRNAGIIGAGGGGFPTYVKLQAKVNTIIANGSECEPLLSSDRMMMEQQAHLLIEGMQAAMQATGAKQGIIGLKKHYTKAIAALDKELPNDSSIKLHLLANYYPAGDEFLLVYEITHKVIPEGGIPLHVGVVVNNVTTLMQVAESLHGKPVVERTITLAGEFNDPQVVTLPIGATYQDLVKIAGGLKIQDAVLIDGGPMMGKIIEHPELGIGKTTSGLIALPADHFIVRMNRKTIPQMVRLSKSACCQCYRCSDLCPRNLIGHNLFPHKTMRTVDYNRAEPTEHITSAFLCSQCGVCELIACDFMLLSPRKIYGALKEELIKKGIKNPHIRTKINVSENFANRKIAIPTLMKKLDLGKYDIALTYRGKKTVREVKVPINRHIGAPARSQVTIGQQVTMCDIIAATPEDKLGAVYHASVTGTVTDINNQFITINKSN